MSDWLRCRHRLAPLYYDAELYRWSGRCPECADLVIVSDEQIARGEAAPKLDDIAVHMLGLDRYVEPHR